MLELKGIQKSFGNVCILNGINFHLEHGKVYTLWGGNGAGKTTLFNIISGFVRPSSGTVRFRNKEMACFLPYQINRLGVGRTFQDLRLVTQMTVRENLLLAMETGKFTFPSKKQREKSDNLMERLALQDKAEVLAGSISYGQQKLLTLGCCIANGADLLLIDELVAGIDKTNFCKIIDIVMSLKESGKTILQIEHHPDYIRATSGAVLTLEGGSRMLKVQHITTGYGKKQVLTDVSLEVAHGEIVLLTGGNGSGKSTVLKTIYGLLQPWTKEGRIEFE
jgi:branched-chain amino acid transport system ATP-binding protein